MLLVIRHGTKLVFFFSKHQSQATQSNPGENNQLQQAQRVRSKEDTVGTRYPQPTIK